MSKLTAEAVQSIFRDCLFKEEELDENRTPKIGNSVKVEGIRTNFGFHPERINQHKEEIKELLRELPKGFQKSDGGWSFLNACMDKHGNHWGEHPNVEQLFALGMGVDLVMCVVEREYWGILPGGMPYYVLKF